MSRRLRRALGVLAVFFTILVLDFALIRLGGSDYAGEARTAGLDAEAQKEIVRRQRAAYRLDDPLPVAFGRWLGDLARGDLGISFATGEPVRARIAAALPATLLVQSTALVLVFAGGILLGVFGAAGAGRGLDRTLQATLLGLHSVPVFWMATLALLFLAGESGLGLFPLEKLRSPRAAEMGPLARGLDLLHHLALPVTCLVLPGLAVVARHAHAEMRAALASEYARTARASGHRERTIVWRYALRNAMGPVATLLGAQVPALIGGSIVVETIFGIEGMGRLVYQSTFEHDYPVLQAYFLLAATATLAGYALSDGLHAWLLPRTRDA